MADPAYPLELDRALARRGLSLDMLREGALAVALFGSRAGGCARPSSDWDIFCVGSSSPRRLPGVDLVRVEQRAVEAPTWLGGDLAGHIAAYGIWLEGAPPWRLDDVCFELAARHKEERIARRLRSIAQIWGLWRTPYREKHAARLRRDVQRLDVLLKGVPIPPTALLDAAWCAQPSPSQLEATLRALGARPDLARELSELA